MGGKETVSPSASDIVSRPVDLGDLLDGIADGSVVLPDFQRDFLWSDGEVASLVATVMMDWPAGSLLLMRGSPSFFQTRAFEGVATKATKTRFVVLDGQQRLTGLFNALRGYGSHQFAVNLDQMETAAANAGNVAYAIEKGAVGAEDIENAIDVEKRGRPYKTNALRVPLTALSSAPDFFEWRDAHMADESEAIFEGDRITRAYKDFLGTVNSYSFPAVVLENDLPAEAVARIFERINRGGMQLSTFDLLVARAYAVNWNLREEWVRSLAECELLQPYLDDDGLLVAQGLSLRSLGDVRRPALLRLQAQEIQTQWADAAEAMDQACRFVRDSGMRAPAWIPYLTLLIPLASLARDHDLEQFREVLEPWLWARSISMAYDVASSTKISSDYASFSDQLNTVPAPITDFVIDSSSFLEATRKQHGALWRTFVSLLLRNSARDPFTGEQLVTEVAENLPTVVPLFDRLSDDPSSPHLRVFAQVLLSRGKRRPRLQTVLSEARSGGTALSNEALESQFLPPAGSEVWSAGPKEIIEYRVLRMMEYVSSQLPAIKFGQSELD